MTKGKKITFLTNKPVLQQKEGNQSIMVFTYRRYKESVLCSVLFERSSRNSTGKPLWTLRVLYRTKLYAVNRGYVQVRGAVSKVRVTRSPGGEKLAQAKYSYIHSRHNQVYSYAVAHAHTLLIYNFKFFWGLVGEDKDDL